MHIAIVSGGTGWHVQDLARAAQVRGQRAEIVDFRRLMSPPLSRTGKAWNHDAVVVRTMPAGSLEQVVFRMDVLHALQASGCPVINPPRALETCVDKYLTDLRLDLAGLPTIETIVCQHSDDALAAFDRLGRDVVVKPLFGAEGRGMVRVTDAEIAWRTFRAIEATGGVLYLQRFVPHPGWDLRVFIIGERIVAGMRRIAHDDWRTNVAQGARSEPIEITGDVAELARKAAQAVGAVIAGVDVLPTKDGEWKVIEVNAVPGWRALAQTTGIDIAAVIVDEIVQRSRA